ncbi:MAG: hypothetical protein Q8L46_01190 [candidate division WWE3 bacterium]|nr:hypothetical protein [candidate division WWE3 bacterium]
MAKRTRKEKENARLRREIEVLKAQVSGQNYADPKPRAEEKATAATPPPTFAKASAGAAPTPLKVLEMRRVDPKFIKADLLKTALLSVLAIAFILVLYLLRSRIPFL